MQMRCLWYWHVNGFEVLKSLEKQANNIGEKAFPLNKQYVPAIMAAKGGGNSGGDEAECAEKPDTTSDKKQHPVQRRHEQMRVIMMMLSQRLGDTMNIEMPFWKPKPMRDTLGLKPRMKAWRKHKFCAMFLLQNFAVANFYPKGHSRTHGIKRSMGRKTNKVPMFDP